MKFSIRHILHFFGVLILALSGFKCSETSSPAPLKINKGSHIMLIGNNLGSRMMNYGYFETELHERFPDSLLYIRNMCDGGNTPGFRPHAGRNSPWAFPGADKFQTELATESDSEGHFESPDEWLTRHKADIIIAFFGYSESFGGPKGLDNYKKELDAFIKHTKSQNYNGRGNTQLAIISPIAFEDLSDKYDLPDGVTENVNLQLYAQAMREVAETNQVVFLDVFGPTSQWYKKAEQDLTADGSQLNDEGYQMFSAYLADQLFAGSPKKAAEYRTNILAAVQEKNWMWHNDYKIPNGVHVFGRRYNPFGPDNYPAELTKIREMTAIRDSAIWIAARGGKIDVAAADKLTTRLPEVQTNYDPENNGNLRYLYGEEALRSLQVPPGYKIELFASEKEFADLANPVQMTFDNKGRLWIATMPSYPHYRPGDEKPNDKLIILEDTDSDGKADKQITFASGLHLPIGFELAPEGVYLSQGTNLVLLKDSDGNDTADSQQILLSGFDDHDTHHAHSAYTTDPSGAIYMGEGVFLHTDVETSYGPVRGTNGGFYRYSPQRRHLERTAQLAIPNPWGIAFDEWGQNIFAETSGPDVRWMMPGSIKPRYGEASPKSLNLIEDKHKVRPTSGLEFIYSRHFPDNVQGDMLINNTIGFLGTKQHTLEDDGTGFKSRHRLDLVKSTDKNFRPVDMEFAPDGSLYLIDWHNVLIGHMQHNARDPLRDHVHGRVYRITYPSRPLLAPAKIADATVDQLLENLKLPEFRTRSRTRRELRARDQSEVLSKLKTWTSSLDSKDPKYEHHLLEALWVTWALNKIDTSLLNSLLHANDFRARSAAVRVLRYSGHQVDQQAELLRQAAGDAHGRVRLEAIVAASWMAPEKGMAILEEAGRHPLDVWMRSPYEAADAHLNGHSVKEKKEKIAMTNLKEADQALFNIGKEIYEREGFCGTCHQPNGAGLPASGFPPIRGTDWVVGNEERLIKLVLNGLHGPMEVLGQKYPGQVPMTPFKGMLKDHEIAAVLTYVRNSFGNSASPVSPVKVAEVREATKMKSGFYSPEELLAQHPLE